MLKRFGSIQSIETKEKETKVVSLIIKNVFKIAAIAFLLTFIF
jgi:hypothetical protein